VALAHPWGAIKPRFVIGLGCEIKYARRLVYAKRLDLTALGAAPMGIKCRLCHRGARCVLNQEI
jgi:hypothetical protein